MPRPAGHPARRRWLLTAAVIAAIAGASGFFSAGLSAGKAQLILREGSVTVSIATRGVPYPANIGGSDFRHLPQWTFERGWWEGGGCTSDTLNVDIPLWIPFAASCLMVGIAPLISIRTVSPSRLQVGTSRSFTTQPTTALSPSSQ
jgi:hypothetical protein